MSSGIFKRNLFRKLEEVKTEYIDAWCKECQFPYGEGKCQSKALIQRCWYELQGIAITLQINSEAHIWHLQHECPFVHQGYECKCNDFKTIEEAFKTVGLEYRR